MKLFYLSTAMVAFVALLFATTGSAQPAKHATAYIGVSRVVRIDIWPVQRAPHGRENSTGKRKAQVTLTSDEWRVRLDA